MSTDDDRWTAETEELVAQTVYAAYRWDTSPPTLDALPAKDHGYYRKGAHVVLATLADAGLLLPPGGETRETRDCPYSSCRTHAFTKHTHRRSVTTWPDGSVHTGPWVAVSET